METGKSKILFDFGAGKAAYDNARKLNIGMSMTTYGIVYVLHPNIQFAGIIILSLIHI